MSAYTITINDNGLVPGDIADIRASVEKAVIYLDQFIDWQGSLDLLIDIKTNAQAITDDYQFRYLDSNGNPDPTQYPNGLLPSILDFTGSGNDQKTVALQESTTGIDANGTAADAGFTIYLGEDGAIRNLGLPAFFDSGTDYAQHSPVSPGAFDFASVALHEVLHGLGFAIGSGFFKSFLSDENGVPTYQSSELNALTGTGVPFQINGDHYGQAGMGPVQSGAMFIFGNYAENRFDIGLGDLALLESMGYSVHNKPIGPLFDTLDGSQINGTDSSNILAGTLDSQTILAGGGDDTITARTGTDSGGNDFVDGGAGADTVVYSGNQSDYELIENNGYVVVRDRGGIDGVDLLTNIELVKFDDSTVDLTAAQTFATLFAANLDTANGLASAYEVLLSGVPNQAGFTFLINNAVSTNFGAGPGVTFNEENIFINLVNNLVQGNADAKAEFDALATGTTLEEKVSSLYNSVIPAQDRTAEGLAFIIRDEGLTFYQNVAAERGVAGTDGAAIVALASLLKIVVTDDIGIGNAVNDLSKAVAAGSAALPATGTTLTALETADGTAFDADDTAASAVFVTSSAVYASPSDISELAFASSVSIVGQADGHEGDWAG